MQEESDFLDPLREQLGYLGSAKEVHRGRGRSLDALQVRTVLVLLLFLLPRACAQSQQVAGMIWQSRSSVRMGSLGQDVIDERGRGRA